jgi:ligand-binding sensor domain-containing protein
MRIYLLFAFVLVSFSPILEAQRWHASTKEQLSQQIPLPLEDMAHMSWVRRDGAPSDITALAQTKDGYLWIGSRLGLFRFDGLQFSTYPFTTADPQLPSSDIAALAACPDGGLWIGYRMGGITNLRGSKKVDYDKLNGLVSQSTEELHCREDGSMWATADGRLMHLAGATWENYSAQHGLLSEGLYTSFFDREGNLWTAEKGHVYELKKGENKFVEVLTPNHSVNQFAQTPDGAIWISDAWHNVRPLLDDKGARALPIPGVPLLLVDEAGSLWLAPDFGGLTRLKLPGQAGSKVENYSTANGLSDGQTRAILQDKQGTIWVGTPRGLDRFRPSPLVQFHGVRIDYHPALIADKKSGIWIDDMDKPLMRLEEGKLSFLGKAHGSSSLFQETDGGVWLHDPITHNFFRYSGNSATPTMTVPVPESNREVENWCLGQDPQGALLACFEGHGLWRYSGTWEQIKAPGLPIESPIALVRGVGHVWLGYPHNQIALYDGSAFHMFGRDEGLELNSVLTFYDDDGLVLAGGSDGLAYFDGKSFHSLQLRTPGLMRGVSAIIKDRFGDLWLNAGPGVIRLPEKEWRVAIKDPRIAMDFQFLNEQDGLFTGTEQTSPQRSRRQQGHSVVRHIGTHRVVRPRGGKKTAASAECVVAIGSGEWCRSALRRRRTDYCGFPAIQKS